MPKTNLEKCCDSCKDLEILAAHTLCSCHQKTHSKEQTGRECSGCTDLRGDPMGGTHAMHTIQHPCSEGGDPNCGYCFPKEQTAVDLGEDTTCVVCEKRECTCPERQKDGSWKSKEQTFEEKWLAIDEKTWLERSQHPDPQTVLAFFKTEVSELLAEIRLVIGAMEEWDRNATPDEKRDYAQIYKDLESHLDNIAGRYVPK